MLRALVIAVLIAVALPATAAASSVQSPDAGITFTAAAGEQNQVTVTPAPDLSMVRLKEEILDLTPGFGCTRVDSRTVDCVRRGLPVTIDLGDGGDMLEVPSGALPIVARGGTGDDKLLAYGAGPSTLDGGDGRDNLFGGLSADTIMGGPGGDDLRGDVVYDGKSFATSREKGADDVLAGGADSDNYEGGPGLDTVSYADAQGPVTAVLAARSAAEDGTASGQGGEGEALPPDVEGVIGGPGPDSLTGNRASNRLDGGPGNDTIRGLKGSDLLTGGAGGDEIFARDADLDSISCGANATGKNAKRDTLDMDLADGTPPADCETITDGAINEGPNVLFVGEPKWPRADGRVGIRLRCPVKVKIGCNGKITLKVLPAPSDARAAGSSGGYRIKAGQSKLVLVRLSRGERASLRRGARLARITSVEKGRFGPKTTVATLQLKRGG
jgi:hypothetical protein